MAWGGLRRPRASGIAVAPPACVVNVRLHPGTPGTHGTPGASDPASAGNAGTGGSTGSPGGMGGSGGACQHGSGRLHLLISYAGWQSDPWVNRLPRLLEPMGIVTHRASTGREASSVIKSRPIHIAVVDLGLPIDRPERAAGASGRTDADGLEMGEVGEFDEGGTRLLELLGRLAEPPPVVAVTRARSQRDGRREITEALRLGVFAVVERPRELHDLDVMLDVLRRCVEKRYRGCWPGATPPG